MSASSPSHEQKGRNTTAIDYPFDVQFEKVSRCFARISEYASSVSAEQNTESTVLLALATTVIDSEVVLGIGFLSVE